jgi:uncharacterized membrane protein YhfC
VSFDPAIAVGLSVSAAVALLGPPALGLVLWRRLSAPPLAWALGAATFFVSQVVLRLPWQVPLGLWVAKQSPGPAAQTAWLAFSALTAGLFEETGRWVAFRFAWRPRTATGALMLGAGHGGVEAMLLVGLNLAVSAVLFVGLSKGVTLGLPEDALATVRAQFAKLTPSLALAAGLERLSSMAVHCGLSLLVLQAFTRRSAWWLVAAIAFHAASNLAGVVALKGLGVWPAELVIAAFALAALAWTVHLVRADREARASLSSSAPVAPSDEA